MRSLVTESLALVSLEMYQKWGVVGFGLTRQTVAFSTKVEKEVEEDGSEWAVITLRGKWLPFKRF